MKIIADNQKRGSLTPEMSELRSTDPTVLNYARSLFFYNPLKYIFFISSYPQSGENTLKGLVQEQTRMI